MENLEVLSARSLRYGLFSHNIELYGELSNSITIVNRDGIKVDGSSFLRGYVRNEFETISMIRSLLILKTQRMVVDINNKDHLTDFQNYLALAQNINYFALHFKKNGWFSVRLQELPYCHKITLERIMQDVSSVVDVFGNASIRMHLLAIPLKASLPYLHTRVCDYCESKGISLEGQIDSLHTNVLSELNEYLEAETPEGKIDALCDTLVFILGAVNPNGQSFSEKVLSKFDGKVLPKLREVGLYKYILQEDYIGLATACLLAIELDYGYNAYLCMLETLAEVSSRQGYYDKKVGKFVKDKSVESYKADYSKCKK